MRLTILGTCGAWPEPGGACSGFLLEHDGFRLVLDLGYATMPRLLQHVDAAAVDAVFISHGHPDHCADLNPLLRARALRSEPPPPLPVYALPKALDAVLSLDRPGMLDDAWLLTEIEAGDQLTLGPFTAQTKLLPHWTPNAAIRLETSDGGSLVYTGDGGPSPAVIELARGVDVLLAEATYVDEIPPDDRGFLTSARQAGAQAAAAGADRLVLTHLWPGTDPARAVAAAGESHGQVSAAVSGMIVDI